MNKLQRYISENVIHLYWALIFGKPVRRSDFLSLRKNGFHDIDGPVFFLSTGRTGTLWFSRLLNFDRQSRAFHMIHPDLSYQSRWAYALHKQSNGRLTDTVKRALKEMVLIAREQHIRYAYKTDKKLIETNNNLTFFAPVLYDLFPNIKFVHLYRHPGEFICSGLRRKYYQNTSALDKKHIEPVVGNALDQWNNYSRLQKIAWLWFETNNFIENFKQELPDSRIFSLNFNERNQANIQALINFLELDVPAKKIKKYINFPLNQQKHGEYITYQNWPEQDKNQVREICGYLAKYYEYQL